MSSYKTSQQRVLHRGREFHFVSYPPRDANPRTGEEAMPATWFLMRAGKRWPVMPEKFQQEPSMVEAALVRWLDQHVFAA